MANTYFQFKEFTIHQENCAMKVCTDSCIYGAMLPVATISGKPIINAIDIGTGTGLLSLQYAQYNTKATILAVEIDENAYNQAKANVENSIYAKRITVTLADITTMPIAKKMDLIICNPPFYANDLKSSSTTKNMAHHSIKLTLQDVFYKVNSLLTADGFFTLLIPTKRRNDIMQLCQQYGFSLQKEITIHQDTRKKDFRTIVFLSTQMNNSLYQKEHLIIKENGVYTNAFITLLRPFYTIF